MRPDTDTVWYFFLLQVSPKLSKTGKAQFGASGFPVRQLCFSPNQWLHWSVPWPISATIMSVQEVGSANSSGSTRYFWIWGTIKEGRSLSRLSVRQCLLNLKPTLKASTSLTMSLRWMAFGVLWIGSFVLSREFECGILPILRIFELGFFFLWGGVIFYFINMVFAVREFILIRWSRWVF